MPEVIDTGIATTWIERVAAGRRELVSDQIAVEEPLEIQIDGRALAVTMRTPGNDEELVAGFLLGEGLIGPDGREIAAIGPNAELEANIIDVRTRHGLRRDPFDQRRFHMTSSCGVCGKGALEQIRLQAPDRPPSRVGVDPGEVEGMLDRARAAQRSFERTGAVHATGLFATAGELLVLHEDVGRHNAMDKAIGSLVLAGAGVPDGVIACLSGRIGFELVQKAVMAGIGGLVAVGAPTSLAVSLAQEHDLLVCGFVRDGSFNVYAGATQLHDDG